MAFRLRFNKPSAQAQAVADEYGLKERGGHDRDPNAALAALDARRKQQAAPAAMGGASEPETPRLHGGLATTPGESASDLTAQVADRLRAAVDKQVAVTWLMTRNMDAELAMRETQRAVRETQRAARRTMLVLPIVIDEHRVGASHAAFANHGIDWATSFDRACLHPWLHAWHDHVGAHDDAGFPPLPGTGGKPVVRIEEGYVMELLPEPRHSDAPAEEQDLRRTPRR
jgi:hypothetical protein